MLKDVDKRVNGAKLSARLSDNSATRPLREIRKKDVREAGLGTFRGMLFALPLALAIWLLLGLLAL